jgi:hypothetical protein
MDQAALAGAVIGKPAHDTFWGGYAGCPQGPDQHRREVARTPGGSVGSEGRRARDPDEGRLDNRRGALQHRETAGHAPWEDGANGGWSSRRS